jgi:hypothetical protein
MIKEQNIIKNDDEFDIPLNITDFLDVCKAYAKLGTYQVYIDQLAEDNETQIPINIIPNLITFFESISYNPYFGDAKFLAIETTTKLKTIMKNHNKTLN